jgi:probable phosphoglycerate mutase
VRADDDLQELRPGEADGLTIHEWQLRYVGSKAVPFDDPSVPFAPGGESRVDFLERAGAGLARLLSRHPNTSIVVVCHAGVIEASFYLALGLQPTNCSVAFPTLNTSITHWRHDEEKARHQVWTLVAFNDAYHLKDQLIPALEPKAIPTSIDELQSQTLEFGTPRQSP